MHSGFGLQAVPFVIQLSSCVAFSTPVLSIFPNNSHWQTFNTTQQERTFTYDLTF
jgi:hypothetical protein